MRKIELLQIGKTNIQSEFSTYAAGIYWKHVSLSQAIRDSSPVTTILGGTWGDSLSLTPIDISGASYENLSLSEVISIEEMYLQSGCFYFDFANQDLYISLFDYHNFTHLDSISVGETIGFVSQAQLVNINGVNYPLNTFLGSVFYEPRLEEVGISNQLNDQKNGLFVFSDLEVSIKNNDGAHDDIKDSITGNTAVLLIANLSDSKEEEIETGFPYKISADPEDFVIKRKGIVETVDYSDPDKPVIRAIDERANWTQKISPNLLTVAEFPNLPDKYINDRKALCIGAVNGVKCVPLRDDSTAASFDYFIADTSIGAIQSVSGVYFKGQIDTGGGKEDIDRFLTITTEYTINLTTGIVTILNCIKGDVYVYGVFTTMEETVEIILFLLAEYGNTQYISNNFNLLEIEAIRDLGYTTHVYINGKGKKLFEVIQKLCSDILCDMFPQGDVLTIRQSNVETLPIEDIPNNQIVQNPPPWDNNRTDTIKTIAVQYNEDYRQDLFETYYDNSLEATALLENLKAEDQIFTVNLTDPAQIETIYTAYYNRFIIVPRTVRFDRTIPFMAGLGDFVTFEIVRQYSATGIEQFQIEVIKTIVDGTIKTTDLLETKLAVLNKKKNIPVKMNKEIFASAVYKITSIDDINNSIEAVYFADARDIEFIIEWSATPSLILEWSATPSLIWEAK